MSGVSRHDDVTVLSGHEHCVYMYSMCKVYEYMYSVRETLAVLKVCLRLVLCFAIVQ